MSFDAANHILNDTILEKIAKMMWERDVVAKYKNKYIIESVT